MSASYEYRPVIEQTVGSFDLGVAQALAAYFGCEPHELGDNCQLTPSDVHMLKALCAVVMSDQREELEEMIGAIDRWGAIRIEVIR